MAKFLKKIQQKWNRKLDDLRESITPKPVKPDFVESYTLANPKNVLAVYDYWELCKKMPVAYEDENNKSSWLNGVMLETSIILPLLRKLKSAPKEISDIPEMRTISIVHLSPKHEVYILPNPTEPKSVVIDINTASTNKYDWVFYMNPEKRYAIVNEIKKHTR